jgi:hypothetical protein
MLDEPVKRLMVISCSGSKNSSSSVLPAIDRYTGGVYGIIKKARREGYWPKDTDILIISAKYGLIAENTLIEMYEQKMDKSRAIELRSEVSSRLDEYLKAERYAQIFINLGSVYLQSIAFSTEIDLARRSGILQEAEGAIGKRLRQTRVWIEDQYRFDCKTSSVM